ncbi:hypothetical protein H072_2044 [Dactylellina haptotyla CBS 200.50]|uniref:Uncharacterized protein n=1 Tax=Dactylellina haptotyla (strain CBS 200.50) TaxID=1284197 RepID=S8ALM7_DACHA|nr:hypothetical protein H072_2044 [Dactylellina haptotyla CBS 200.50]
MSIPKTPTYDKSHYSWQPPSSQASQSLIQDPGDAAPPEVPAGTPVDVSSYFHLPHQPSDVNDPPTGDPPLDSPPGLLRRSTFNYKQSSEEYKKQLEEEDGKEASNDIPAEEAAGGRRGSITSKPFKPSAKRTKSWDYRDKRGEMQMTMMQQEGQEPGAGFSES